jgi:5'-phosphate synthase pdxT subunit
MTQFPIPNSQLKIGILAIQGSVIEHKQAMEKLSVGVVEVRLPDDLKGIDGIILPGGESTTISKLMKRFGLFDELKKRISDGLPAWGTCAGAILLAKKVTGKNPPPTLQVMDIEVCRNAYGRHLDSFQKKFKIKDLRFKIQNFDGIFIRAPKIRPFPNSEIEVLAECDGEPVMLRQRNILVTSFHPELTDDLTIHEFFAFGSEVHAFKQNRANI